MLPPKADNWVFWATCCKYVPEYRVWICVPVYRTELFTFMLCFSTKKINLCSNADLFLWHLIYLTCLYIGNCCDFVLTWALICLTIGTSLMYVSKSCLSGCIWQNTFENRFSKYLCRQNSIHGMHIPIMWFSCFLSQNCKILSSGKNSLSCFKADFLDEKCYQTLDNFHMYIFLQQFAPSDIETDINLLLEEDWHAVSVTDSDIHHVFHTKFGKEI